MFNILKHLIFRLYTQERIDGTQSSVKWTCPNIHDLINILERIKIANIVDEEFDKRLTRIQDLTVVQLREECALRNLSTKGLETDLCSRISEILGPNAKVLSHLYSHFFPDHMSKAPIHHNNGLTIARRNMTFLLQLYICTFPWIIYTNVCSDLYISCLSS